MNAPVVIGWLFVGALGMLSIVIFFGKASFLIAGFNTSSEEDKNKYDMQRLSKVVGGGFILITIISALGVFYEGDLPHIISWLIPWGIFGIIAAMFIISNTVCKKR